MELDEKKLASVREAVAKIVSGEITIEEASTEYKIDASILEPFVEEAQGEKLKDAPKGKKNYDDGSTEPAAPSAKPDQEIKGGTQVKEAKEKDKDKSEEDDTSKDEELDESTITEDAAGAAKIREMIAGHQKAIQELSKPGKTGDVASAKRSRQEAIERLKQKLSKINENIDLDLELQNKVTREDIAVDVKEHLDAFFKGEDLSEDFRSKVANLFEGAVIATSQKIITANVAKLEEQAQERISDKVDQLEEATETYKEELNAKVDEYLAYVVEGWVQENKPVIKSNLRSELTESFILGLKGLFEDHYIDIPEEKVSVVEDFAARLEASENEVAKLISEKAELRKEKEAILKESAFERATNTLSDGEKEKFSSLAESVEFRDLENYEKALTDIRESYFDGNSAQVLSVEVDDTPIQNLEEQVAPKKEDEAFVEASSTLAYMRKAIKK